VTCEDWPDLLREASRLRSAGRVKEAIIAYQRLLEKNPYLPDSWYNLGLLQRHAREFEQALISYQRSLDLGVAGPEEVHVNRAVIYSDHLFRPDLAERELDQALALKPDHVPALLNLGNLREDLGERDAAREAYARALECDPGNILGLARLGSLSHGEAGDGVVENLRSALARPGLAAADRADLGFALGGLLDAAGQYDAAFALIAEANRSSRESGGPAAHYDRAAHERVVDRLIAAFDEPIAEGAASEGPLFICGMFRSGSTLVEQILARHSEIVAGGELQLIPLLAAEISGYPETVATAAKPAIAKWRQSYLSALPEGVANGLVTDKRPDNFLHVGLIKTLFPAAKIIHTRRDPLDNLLSLYFVHLNPSMSYALDLEDAAHWYIHYRRLMAHWRRIYPGDIIDVDYDALVRDPRGSIEPVLAACGLQWQDEMLDFHRSREPVKTASVWQVRQPLHSRSSGRWRHYANHLAQVRRRLDAAEA
jgi:tetratricopeptide (TPR) repeat protein